MLRGKQHKVFAKTASKGKSSMGWFFGFKLHLIVNHKGQIVDFALTTGQVADNSKDLLNKLLEKISGTLFGDKGYFFDLEHTRHRKPQNAFVHIVASLVAYQFYPNKPQVDLAKIY
ncbi:MAG: transposase [Sphingobacteriales bacterium]|nr:transposase [Sphingobacteriales bacterium]